jgi:N-acetyl-anhydromuramyl-L-alanine amidase AmpD
MLIFKILISIFVFAFFIGCQEKMILAPKVFEPAEVAIKAPQKLRIIDKNISRGYEVNSSRYIDTIVVHTAHNIEFAGDPYGIDELVRVFEKYGVASHYVIGREGTIYRLVDESLVAKHAGKSRMSDGREGANLFSIGIELINSKTDYPTTAQYNALATLIKDIKSRFAIQYIVGHKDIAPTRKSDPWNFDFERLHTLLKDKIENKNERITGQTNIRNEEKRP